jgi:hypothetical protein
MSIVALTMARPSLLHPQRAQVVRRQPDGTWLRLLDQPGLVSNAAR